MAATRSPSHSQNDDVQHPDPNPTQPPQTETLDLPTPPQPLEPADSVLILDADDQQSGTIRTALPEPIVLTDDTEKVTSPTNQRRVNNKRKKAGTRKTYKRKRPTKKVQNLTNILNPIPFVPAKTLDLDKHEEVLKRLGLYDFSKIEFDRSLRNDLIVQLIANYDAKKRCSYVNDLRINVNRAELGRALKLPPAKQDRGSGGVEEVDLDSEVFLDEAIVFIEDFVANWMVLRDESSASVVPAEIVNWTRCIKDGHPEKLDSASLIWYKVEKELTQGDKLVNCYYASHLQYLIKLQRPTFFKDEDGEDDDGEEHVIAEEEKEEKEGREEEEKNENLDKDEQEEKDEGGEKDESGEKDEKQEKDEKEEKEVEEENVSVVQEQNIELNLGTDVEEIVHEESTKDDEMMVDAEEGNEEMEEQVDFKNILGDHFLQRCQSSDLNNFEAIKVQEDEDEQVEHVEDEDEEEEGGERLDEGFDIEANDDSFDRDGLTDNFLQGVETSHNPYNPHGMSSMDLFGSRDGSFMSHGGPSFYNNGGKRVMEPEEDIHHPDQKSKRLKTDEIWDPKQNDIGFCFDQMQQYLQKAKMIHESKERSYENLQYNQQMEVQQLQERQQIMEMYIKSKDEDLEKKHAEVFRLERELYLMGDLLAGYRKALNDTRFKFSEYRKRFSLQEEPLYKDAGPGGLVLSTREIEKQRLKQQEEMMKFQSLAKNIEEEYVYQLEIQNSRLSPMVDKLVFIENEVQKLNEKAPQPKETRDEPSAELEPSVEPEETQKLMGEDELLIEPEKNQKSMDEDECPVEPEKNQKLMDEDECSVEPEKTQKSMDEEECSVEPEKDKKSMDEDESFVEPEKNPKSPVEISENDASMEGVLPDAGESEEKRDGEED